MLEVGSIVERGGGEGEKEVGYWGRGIGKITTRYAGSLSVRLLAVIAEVT